MAARHDALLGAAHLIAALGALPDRCDGVLHTSVGRLEVRPNSPNVVPGEAVLFLELRSPEQAVLDWAEREMLAQADAAAAAARVRHEARFVDRRPVGFFDEGLVTLAAAEAASLGMAVTCLDTIAAHDAISMIPVCPSIVLVVPSVGGVCHHPSEFTRAEDLELGADLLARMLWRLARDGIAASGRDMGGRDGRHDPGRRVDPRGLALGRAAWAALAPGRGPRGLADVPGR